MSKPGSPQVVAMSLDPTLRGVVDSFAQGQEITEWQCDLIRLMEMKVAPTVQVILCGPPPEGTELVELAQFLRMQYPKASIYYLTTVRAGFVRKDFLKNGFTDAFIIPLDTSTFGDAFKADLVRVTGGKLKAYRAVKLIDLHPDLKLDFDTFIYLPANTKYIKMTAAGDTLDPERIQKLSQHKMSNMHISADETQKFYQWTAQQLIALGSSETMSATEKRDRMKKAVRELISDIFTDSASEASFEKGKSVVQDCQEIVRAYIMASVKNSGEGTTWYDKLLQLSQNENSAYNHASSTATFAAMFSMALGIGKPEQVAMAGLLHDIGLSELPAEVQTKPEAERTPEEQAEYQKHPKLSVQLIQTRKMVVPEVVQKIILQHHERFDGAGYPDGVKGLKIRPEAQIVAIADQLFYLSSTPREGKPPMTPLRAIELIHTEATTLGQDTLRYDPEIVKKLYTLFKPEAPQA